MLHNRIPAPDRSINDLDQVNERSSSDQLSTVRIRSLVHSESELNHRNGLDFPPKFVNISMTKLGRESTKGPESQGIGNCAVSEAHKSVPRTVKKIYSIVGHVFTDSCTIKGKMHVRHVMFVYILRTQRCIK